ncbi:MAG: SDR family oxidoreductase [Rhodocyclaceae bacterium]|nr:SDR family oxidoreductase [Rhodocyclaceae bacterium]
MSPFAGKSILVTGASSGIGRAVAVALLAGGARVVCASRDTNRLADLALADGRMIPLCLDLLDDSSFGAIAKALPELDGVVHSAGIVDVRPAAFFSMARYRSVLDTNLTAPLALTAALLRSRRLLRGSSLVFLSSINGNQIAVKGCSAYAASKAGLVGAAKVLALELAPQSIRVNCVLPGAVDTAMTASLAHTSAESVSAERAAYPLGQRFASPQEVAGAVLFLLSDAAGFVTGQCLTVDGGCSVQ